MSAVSLRLAERQSPVASRSLRVLVVGGPPDVAEALRMLLMSEGLAPHFVPSAREALDAVVGEDHDVVLMDLRPATDATPGGEGVETIARLRELDPALPVVVMTAWANLDGAVEAMRRGARDYVQRPWDAGRLVATLRREAEFGATLRRSQRLVEEATRQRALRLPRWIARAEAMVPVTRAIERAAASGADVLLVGEQGAGKGVVARSIHQASVRSARPFIAVDASSMAPGELERELFGHAHGAGAGHDRPGCFELADGGTLLVGEIGKLSLVLQGKLLRVLLTGELRPVGSLRTRAVDVRVLATTRLDLAREVAEGRFRDDLLQRLRALEISLPPLRERRDDVLPLAEHFLERLGRRARDPVPTFAPEAREALVEHPWPGNVRQLRHVVERALLAARGEIIGVADLGLHPPTPDAGAPVAADVLALDRVEADTIRRALARTRGNVIGAAAILGLSRSALYRRLTHFGIKTR